MKLNENMGKVSFEVGPNFFTFFNTIFNPLKDEGGKIKQLGLFTVVQIFSEKM